MKSPATTVPAYLAALPTDRKAALVRLRAICRESIADSSEVMQYGMPCFQRGGQNVLAFASQKQHISVYVGPEALDPFRDRLGKLRVGRGCVRYPTVEQMDFGLLSEIVRHAAKINVIPPK